MFDFKVYLSFEFNPKNINIQRLCGIGRKLFFKYCQLTLVGSCDFQDVRNFTFYIMPTGKHLTGPEKKQSSMSCTRKEQARAIARNQCVVSNYFISFSLHPKNPVGRNLTLNEMIRQLDLPIKKTELRRF